MNSVDFIVDGKTYELRLTTRTLCKLETRLGKNPLCIFTALDNGDMPQIQDIICILQHCLFWKYEADFRKLDNVYDLFDDYVEDGGDAISLIPTLVEVFQVSGILPKDGDDTKN